MKKRQTLRDRLRTASLVDETVSDEALVSLLNEKKILVNGVPATSLARLVSDGESVTLYQDKHYVGRGAHKLNGALDFFQLSAQGKIAADVGSSTGGFTQVLLERGAAKVYAIDVGYGELAWQIRSNAKVVVMERQNAREITALPDEISLVTMDLSFISVLKVLPSTIGWLVPDADLIILIKPQFEATRGEIPVGGVINDETLNNQIVDRTIANAAELGLLCLGKSPSVIKGGDGNQEWFAHFKVANSKHLLPDAMA